jgi:glycosyltransferase involved in cell wall biosynthesis
MHTSTDPRVSVCIATYKRNDRLLAVLNDLAKQDRLPDQVVVVDNDAAGGAKAVIEQCRTGGAPFPIDYDVQPLPNIAVTRNRTVELASGNWLAFIDDDERAPNDWLRQLLQAAEHYRADGVLAPVEPQVPPTAPGWISRGQFYDFPHQPDGATVPLNCMRFGNVLLRADQLRLLSGPFDANIGLMAGEDVDLLVRLAHTGARIIWCEGAPVYEPIEQKRLSLRWLMQRAFSGGQGFARYTVQGGFEPIDRLGRCMLYVRAFLQAAVALGMMLFSLPFGRHRAAAWLIKAAANFGKITVLWGGRYSSYARA